MQYTNLRTISAISDLFSPLNVCKLVKGSEINRLNGSPRMLASVDFLYQHLGAVWRFTLKLHYAEIQGGYIPPDFDLGDAQFNHPTPPDFPPSKVKKGQKRGKKGKEKKEKTKNQTEDNEAFTSLKTVMIFYKLKLYVTNFNFILNFLNFISQTSKSLKTLPTLILFYKLKILFHKLQFRFTNFNFVSQT